jgi:hypothetical protein
MTHRSLLLMMMLVACESSAQVPFAPSFRPQTLSRTGLGPTSALFADPADAGGVPTAMYWSFRFTSDGGVLTIGPQPNLNTLAVQPYLSRFSTFSQCQSLFLRAWYVNDAGSSLTVDDALTWDAVGPPAIQSASLNLLMAATTGGVPFTFAPVVDDCGLSVAYVPTWTLLQPDGGTPKVSDQGPTYPTSPPARVAMGPGAWGVMLTPVDDADNAGPTAVAPGVTHVAPSGVPVPTGLAVLQASPINLTFASLSWTAVAGASEYVVLVSSGDGTARTVQHPTGRFSSMSPLVDGDDVYAQVASVMPDGGVSQWSAPTPHVVVDLTPPTAPTAFFAVPTGSQLAFSWSASTDPQPPTGHASGVAGYRVEQSLLGTTTWSPLCSTGALITACIATGQTGVWTMRVTASDVAGNVSAPAVANVTIDIDGPPAPGAPVPSGPDALGQVSLSWNAVVDPPVGSKVTYELQRSPAGASAWSPVSSTSPPSSVDTPPVGDWVYRVRGVDVLGNAGPASPSSVVVSISPCPADAGSLVACGQVCVDKLTDPANCGSCGFSCALGDVCVLGGCVSDAGVDAGLDAGAPDAGTPDAGSADAGGVDAGTPDAGGADAGGWSPATRDLLVGCGCSEVDGGASLGLLAALLTIVPRRQKVAASMTKR